MKKVIGSSVWAAAYYFAAVWTYEGSTNQQSPWIRVALILGAVGVMKLLRFSATEWWKILSNPKEGPRVAGFAKRILPWLLIS